MADVQVRGLAQLHQVLQSLPTDVEVKVLRGGLRAGQKVVQQRAQALAPAKSGALRSSIKVRLNTKAQKRGFVRADVVAGGKTAWYAHLVEFGTGQHYAGKGSSSVRKPYIIRAKTAAGGREVTTGMKRRALRVGGAFVNQVVHPGIRPAGFMQAAAQDLDGPALAAFVQYVQARLPREIEKANTP